MPLREFDIWPNSKSSECDLFQMAVAFSETLSSSVYFEMWYRKLFDGHFRS